MDSSPSVSHAAIKTFLILFSFLLLLREGALAREEHFFQNGWEREAMKVALGQAVTTAVRFLYSGVDGYVYFAIVVLPICA
jgi:hypothetical protein